MHDFYFINYKRFLQAEQGKKYFYTKDSRCALLMQRLRETENKTLKVNFKFQ